ncbi:MAG: membrane dipeptidase [Actinobacteria bacterium]|nr:membrane dipeptidase [Actinomycetota bacterium]
MSKKNPRIGDAHNDLLQELAFRESQPNPFGEHWLGQLHEGGVALTVCPANVALDHLPEGALRAVLTQAGGFHRAVRENRESVLWACGEGDLEAAESSDRIALILRLEGTESLGYSPALIDPLVTLGVRMVGLSWNRRNPFADGVGEDNDGGLSALGRSLVDRLAARQVAIDLSHVGRRAFDQALEQVPDAHFIVSHAGCRAVYDTPRNLTDGQMEALATAGGVIGVLAHPVGVGIEGDGATLDKVVDHLDHAVRVVGIERVAIGSDFTRQIVRSGALQVPPDVIVPAGMELDAALDGLAGPSEFPNLAEALENRGYGRAEREAILYGNLRRFLDEVLAHHPPSHDR